MYSKKICAFFLFFIILCFVSADGSTLRLDYYDKTCRGLQDIVWDGVVKATDKAPRIPASLLRLHFHDCFVLGCEASLLLDGSKGEQFAGPNNNSILGLDVIDGIKADVEKQCNNTVSCADILALAARDAVMISLSKDHYGYQPWEVELGRLDGMHSSLAGANREIPGPNDSVDTIISKFVAKGLSIQDMVALSGAHTIGFAKCSSFKTRLYVPNSTRTVNHTLLDTLRQTCPNNSNSDNNIAPLDRQTKYIFDISYYANIVNKAGVLQSDQALMDNRTTIGWVKKYKDHPEIFMNDFAEAMKKMGRIGVITKGGNGEIRNKCGSRNTKSN